MACIYVSRLLSDGPQRLPEQYTHVYTGTFDNTTHELTVQAVAACMQAKYKILVAWMRYCQQSRPVAIRLALMNILSAHPG